MFLLILLLNSGVVIGDNSAVSITNPYQSFPSCFTEGRTWSTEESIDVLTGINNSYSCQEHCLDSPNCHEFTWYNDKAAPLKFSCFLFDQTTTEYSCNNCVSGPQSCICQTPEPQNHGDWFCPPSRELDTCHLECDPGYISNNGTIITCHQGDWSSFPHCVTAIGLIASRNFYPEHTVEIYGEGLHKKLPDLPDRRAYHTLDMVNSDILLCGGAYTETSCLALDSTQQWIAHSTTTSPRSFHASIAILGKLYLLGGAEPSPTGGKSTTEVLKSPSDQWNPSWDLMEDNESSCSTKIGPEVLIMSGGGPYPNSAVSYNVTSGEATRLQDLITGRWSHGCVFVKRRDTNFRGVLVAGGEHGGIRSEIYDVTRGKWSTTGQLTTSRNGGVRMILLGENILAMGGFHIWNQEDLSTVDKFNLTSLQWTVAENMLEPRRYHAVTGVPPSAVGIHQD